MEPGKKEHRRKILATSRNAPRKAYAISIGAFKGNLEFLQLAKMLVHVACTAKTSIFPDILKVFNLQSSVKFANCNKCDAALWYIFDHKSIFQITPCQITEQYSKRRTTNLN